MATTKSNLITNSDATPVVMNDVGLSGGRMRVAQDNFEVAAADFDADGDIIRLCRLPVNARVLSIKLWSDDMGGSGTLDCGIYPTDSDTPKDDDFYATDFDSSGQATDGAELRFEAANIDTLGDKLWENAGDSSNPGGHYDICLTAEAGFSNAFTCAFQVVYTID